MVEADIRREDTYFRNAIPAAKKLGITLQWLARGSTFGELANKYFISKSAVHGMVHNIVRVLCNRIVDNAIKFPTGVMLDDTIAKFEAMSRLRNCAGAVDGTFMKMPKPTEWGDTYWCYKNYCAITVLAVVDADNIFTYVDAGRAGSLGHPLLLTTAG